MGLGTGLNGQILGGQAAGSRRKSGTKLPLFTHVGFRPLSAHSVNTHTRPILQGRRCAPPLQLRISLSRSSIAPHQPPSQTPRRLRWGFTHRSGEYSFFDPPIEIHNSLWTNRPSPGPQARPPPDPYFCTQPGASTKAKPTKTMLLKLKRSSVQKEKPGAPTKVEPEAAPQRTRPRQAGRQAPKRLGVGSTQSQPKAVRVCASPNPRPNLMILILSIDFRAQENKKKPYTSRPQGPGLFARKPAPNHYTTRRTFLGVPTLLTLPRPPAFLVGLEWPHIAPTLEPRGSRPWLCSWRRKSKGPR